MNRTMRFAPISGGPSGRLRLVTWYFATTAGLMILFLVLGLVHAAVVPGSEVRAGLVARPTSPLIALALYALLLLTARLLHHGLRAGAVLGALLLMRSIVRAALSGEWLTLDLATNVIGLVLIISIWGELRGNERAQSHASRA